MPIISRDELRERLQRDLSGVVVTAASNTGNGAGEPPKEAPELLRTSDILIQAERLPDVATYLRDTLGYGFLSDIVAVDYLAHGLFELVYRFYTIEGGGELVIKVRVPREQPDVPSLTPIWPGADLNEREAYDLFGINFIGHPYLKRIYLWDEFEGYPMRKDFPKQGDNYLDEG
ncbi:MAG: NADH-quinone oxidoreductase subunit C [Chloroflexaceae bacterium]|nr:NADH-quinone oxidoreductase subunit C [Chloroflexaceae bacterium]NJO06607.1 NADH-quinone oxidoreductase subunit C [Chloroflexaceae bacterium]NJO83003.1 NADH-quinone oxidoreductase subunit C [Blastochloris sp.]